MEQTQFIPTRLTEAVSLIIGAAQPTRDIKIYTLKWPDIVNFVWVAAMQGGGRVDFNGNIVFASKYIFSINPKTGLTEYSDYTYVVASSKCAAFSLHNGPTLILYTDKCPSFGTMPTREIEYQPVYAIYGLNLTDAIKSTMFGTPGFSQREYLDLEPELNPFLMSDESVSRLTELLATIPTSKDDVTPNPTISKASIMNIVGINMFEECGNSRRNPCGLSYVKVNRPRNASGSIITFDITKSQGGIEYSYESLYCAYKALFKVADAGYTSSVYLSDTIRGGLEYIVKNNSRFASDPNMYEVDQYMQASSIRKPLVYETQDELYDQLTNTSPSELDDAVDYGWTGSDEAIDYNPQGMVDATDYDQQELDDALMEYFGVKMPESVDSSI